MLSVFKHRYLHSMSKRTPCNECREHKRRCSGDSPCERCQRFKLDCVYIIEKSPKDEEYIQEVEMIQQIDTLRHNISLMEAEISKLQQRQLLNPRPSPFTASSTEVDSSDGSTYSPIIDDTPHDSNDESSGVIKENRIIAQNEQGYAVSVAPNGEALNWELTVEKGKLSIRTNIHNHTELLDCLHKMVTTIEFESKIPMEFGCLKKGKLLSSVIRTLVLKRHGKSRFKGFIKEMMLMTNNERRPGRIPAVMVDMRQLTENLFWAYARCQHHFHLSMHVPTAYEMWIARGRSDHSPAALSLCALAALHPCRHVTDLIPTEQSLDYASYFEERAREELSERFDEISLEIFATNVYLSLYSLHVNKVEEAQKYKAMAARMAHILEQQYPTVDPGESSLFYRLLQAHNRSSMLSRVILWELERRRSNDRLKHRRNSGEDIAKERERSLFSVEPVPGDTPQVIAYIRTYQTYNILYNEAFRILKSFEGTDLMSFVGVFGHQFEMMMRAWYYQSIPPESRLSLPLFDDTIPEDIYYGTLMIETAYNTIPIITTLRVYAEYLIMLKSYLPDRHVINHQLALGMEGRGDRKDRFRTRHHIHKILMTRSEVDFDGSDEEYLKAVLGALKIDTRDLKKSMIGTGVKAARCCLHLLRFVVNYPREICVFDPRVCTDGYETLRRIAKIYAYDDREYSIEICELMKEYLDLMRDALEHEPLIWRLSKKLPLMEKQLNEIQRLLDGTDSSGDDLSDFLNL
ncbi:hypothetical protein BX666DRAFT_1937347 [Dichotomocladium elegans]|nr:hypothetical protein BX666DRAFT_1937347 [Dichotomocladium elegans]